MLEPSRPGVLAWLATGVAIAFEEVHEHSALRLAQIVTYVAASVAADRATGGSGYLETDFDRSLERHYVGLADLYPHHADAGGTSYLWGDCTRGTEKENLWEEQVETGRLENELLHVAASIGGSAIEDARDRLLLNMSGRGVSARVALGLRIAGLEVDGDDALYDTSGGPGWRIPLLQTDDCDGVSDFWTLVRASEDLDGFLFGMIDGGRSYGRVSLQLEDLERILESRFVDSVSFQARTPLPNGGADASNVT